MDSFCSEQGISTIDILKIDAQGAELLVLKGAENLLRGRKIRVIQSELMFVPVYRNQPFFYENCAFLGAYGYSLVNLFNLRFDTEEKRQIKWADGLFIHRGWILETSE